jgi:hypothetical protein
VRVEGQILPSIDRKVTVVTFRLTEGHVDVEEESPSTTELGRSRLSSIPLLKELTPGRVLDREIVRESNRQGYRSQETHGALPTVSNW